MIFIIKNYFFYSLIIFLITVNINFSQSSSSFKLTNSSISSIAGKQSSSNFILTKSNMGKMMVGSSFSTNFVLNGSITLTDINIKDEISNEFLPNEYRLWQNYPNPFNPSTSITFDLVEPTNVKIHIISVLGKQIKSYDFGYRNAGRHFVFWDGRDNSGKLVSSGIYCYQLISENFTAIKKMLLLK